MGASSNIIVYTTILWIGLESAHFENRVDGIWEGGRGIIHLSRLSILSLGGSLVLGHPPDIAVPLPMQFSLPMHFNHWQFEQASHP